MLWGTQRKQVSKAEQEALFKQQDGRCNYCGHKLGHSWDVDHKMPLSRGGRHRFSNWQLLCSFCHRHKGNMSVGEFRRKYQLTPARQAKGPPTKTIPHSRFEEVTKEAADAKNKTAKNKKKQRDSYWGWS